MRSKKVLICNGVLIGLQMDLAYWQTVRMMYCVCFNCNVFDGRASILQTWQLIPLLELYARPDNVYHDSEHGSSVLPMEPTLGIREGESVYDFAWFPLMNAQGRLYQCVWRICWLKTPVDPSTCCFITSVRDHPIQLWDYTGSVRASYRAIDHCERFIGPNVLAFNLDGSK